MGRGRSVTRSTRRYGAGALRGAAAVGSMLVRHAVKRYRSASRSRSTARSVRRRVTIKTKTGNNSVQMSQYVKCKDHRIGRKKSKQFERFRAKVHSAIAPDFQKKELIDERAFVVSNGLVANPSDQCQVRGIFQIGMDLLYQDGVLATMSPQFCESLSAVESSTNPAGLIANTVINGGAANNGLPGTLPNTIANHINSLFGVAYGTTGFTQRRVHQLGRSLQVQFRNPNAFGMKLKLYICRSKQNIPTAVAVPSYLQVAGTFAPTSWTWSPIEAAWYGMWKKTGNKLALWNNRSISPLISPELHEKWSVGKMCSVYMPPGGTLNRRYAKKIGRVLSLQHVLENQYDRATTFIMGVVEPEVQIVPRITAEGAIGQQMPAVPYGDPQYDNLTAVANYTGVQEGFTDDAFAPPRFQLIGTCLSRYAYRLLPSLREGHDAITLANLLPNGASNRAIGPSSLPNKFPQTEPGGAANKNF